LTVSDAAPGNAAEQVAVVFPAVVLTVWGAHKLTGVVTVALV